MNSGIIFIALLPDLCLYLSVCNNVMRNRWPQLLFPSHWLRCMWRKLGTISKWTNYIGVCCLNYGPDFHYSCCGMGLRS